MWKLPPADTYFGPILKRTPEGFEIDHLDHALLHVRSFRVAVDAGAHIGTWTCRLAKRFEQVFAFEPASDTYAALMVNVGGLPNVGCLNMALGASGGQGAVEDDPTRPGNTGARYLRPGGSVQVVPLSAFHLPELDFLKIDVEGGELDVLRGGEALILSTRPVICMECKEFSPPRNGGVVAARAYLSQLGYQEVGGVRNDRVFASIK